MSLHAGATAELEFRLPVTVDHAQEFSVCFLDTGDDLAAWSGEGFQPAVLAAVCFDYPAAELAGFDPTEVSLTAAGWFRNLRVPRDLKSGDWIRVAVQVRADGIASFRLNDGWLAEAPPRLTGLDRPTWRVRLQGKAVGARLLVRRLVVWRGARFESE
jgi:hypothetical protein